MPENERRGRLARMHQPWVTYVLLGLVLFSLVLHLLTWLAISNLRSLARAQVVELAEQMDQIEGEVFQITVNIKQPVPINATIPVNQRLTIPISTTVDIDEQIQVPLDTPLGSFEVPVPVQAQIPVNTNVPIEINESVPISTTIDLDLNVPVSIPVAGTPLAEYIQNLKQKLLELSEQL